jgi:hypothetical protein
MLAAQPEVVILVVTAASALSDAAHRSDCNEPTTSAVRRGPAESGLINFSRLSLRPGADRTLISAPAPQGRL